MDTEGFVGFVVDKTETITYNSSGSYPSELGAHVLSWLWDNYHTLAVSDYERADGPVELARRLVHIDPDVQPTPAQLALLRERGISPDLEISERSATDWYYVLRATHGSPERILKSGFAHHQPDWPLDSLFCKWGYLVDFDARRFEVYSGFQERPHRKGRFAGRASRGGIGRERYYPVALVASWSFKDLPTPADFLARLGDSEEG